MMDTWPLAQNEGQDEDSASTKEEDTALDGAQERNNQLDTQDEGEGVPLDGAQDRDNQEETFDEQYGEMIDQECQRLGQEMDALQDELYNILEEAKEHNEELKSDPQTMPTLPQDGNDPSDDQSAQDTSSQDGLDDEPDWDFTFDELVHELVEPAESNSNECVLPTQLQEGACNFFDTDS